jgi:C4-dicarboxylate-specific signal transduction histidine kinase
MVNQELINTSNHATSNIGYWYNQQNINLNLLAQEVQANDYQITPDYLDNWLKNHPDFTKIYLTNKQGNIIASSAPNNQPLSPTLWRGEKITPIHYDHQQQSYSLGLLTPILQEGKQQGLVYVDVKLSTLNQLLQSNLPQESMQLILLDNQEQVIADSSLKHQPLEKFDFEEKGEIRPLGNNLTQWIPLKKGTTPIMIRWKRSFYVRQVKLGEDLPWQLLVKISANPYIQELEKSYTRNLTFMILISLLGLGMSEIISRRLTAPLRELTQVTTDLPRKIAQDIPVHLNAPPYIFELNQLTENFQLMITTLQGQFSKLRQAKSTLEQRVLERTEDLLSLTKNLSQEIKQRELTELSLRESEERYALAVAGTNDGIWDWNIKTNQVYYSPTWLKIVGYEDEPIETCLETWVATKSSCRTNSYV